MKNEAAQMLGITVVGQNYSGAKANKIEEYYQEVYAELKDDEIATFPSAGPVPNSVKGHMAALIAMRGADTFSISNDRFNRIAAKNNIAKREIRKHTQPKWESDAEYRDF